MPTADVWDFDPAALALACLPVVLVIVLLSVYLLGLSILGDIGKGS